MAHLKTVKRDGVEVVKLQCPGCGVWGDIDDDQLHGRISTWCPECGYHETHDFAAMNAGD